MKIKIISLIKRQEETLRVCEEEYLKRIRKSFPCELVEIKRAAILDEGNKQKIIQSEMKKLEAQFSRESTLVVLAKEGKAFDSQELSHWLKERANEGVKELTFVIGGPLGLSEELVRRARWKLALSKLTFPHKLVRVILLEALYRASEISRGSGYHK